jgi:hypothetical protein
MNSIVINHTQNLFKAAISTAQRSNVKTIPYPRSNFRTKKDIKLYLNNLTNFITHPELFYLNKNIHRIQFNKKTKIPETFFSPIN